MIVIPTRLRNKLESSERLALQVLKFKDYISERVNNNRLAFFPDYTDHGPNHVNSVLKSAESIMTDGAWNNLSAADAACLVLAILAHDLGMHITPEEFIALIKTETVITGYDGKTWTKLWDEYTLEFKKWDTKKSNSVFGMYAYDRVPGQDPNTWTKLDFVFIGEFLRRNHPRLAHEILLYGFPSIGGDSPVQIAQGNEHYIFDIAGKIARSHGADLRESVDLIELEDRREYREIHIPYLMAVIRLSDYFQIEAERAPGEIFKIRRLLTPLSNLEWKKHIDIIDIKSMPNDPEAFEIKASPQTVNEYVALSKLFRDIQSELDASWSVSGEIYGRYNDQLGLHGLNIRRVRSNIDNPHTFANKVDYVPKAITLKTANTELVKLMIVPLYGYYPSVGLRELIQNSSDACRELRDYIDRNKFNLNDYIAVSEPDIIIRLIEDGKDKWLSIRDKGIGMSIETIEDYYLNVGASFRNSEKWDTNHNDENGSNEVYRNGKFGVGSLATFLLGDTIKVTTRHVESNTGYEFMLDVTGELIQIDKTTVDVGTEIQVKLSDYMAGLLTDHLLDVAARISKFDRSYSWVWYRASDLKIVWEATDGKITDLNDCNPLLASPPKGKDTFGHWFPVVTGPEFDVHISLVNKNAFVLNGIRVFDYQSNIYTRSYGNNDIYQLSQDNRHRFRTFSYVRPAISIWDRYGIIPVNLQRSGLSVKELPFNDEILKKLLTLTLIYISLSAPEDIALGDLKLLNGCPTIFYEYRKNTYALPYYFISYAGYSINGSAIYDKLGIKRVIFSSAAMISVLIRKIEYRDAAFIVSGSDHDDGIINIMKMINSKGANDIFGVDEIKGLMCVVSARTQTYMWGFRKLDKEYTKKLSVSRLKHGLVQISRKIAKSDEELTEIVEYIAEKPGTPYIEVQLGEKTPSASHIRTASAIESSIRNYTIPFILSERREVFRNLVEFDSSVMVMSDYYFGDEKRFSEE